MSINNGKDAIQCHFLEVAKNNDGVLQTPPPAVWFDEFGDSSLNFTLVVWTSQYTTIPHVLKSQLYFEIFRQFKIKGVEIPFPQRDLHLRTGFEKFK